MGGGSSPRPRSPRQGNPGSGHPKRSGWLGLEELGLGRKAEPVRAPFSTCLDPIPRPPPQAVAFQEIRTGNQPVYPD